MRHLRVERMKKSMSLTLCYHHIQAACAANSDPLESGGLHQQLRAQAPGMEYACACSASSYMTEDLDESWKGHGA